MEPASARTATRLLAAPWLILGAALLTLGASVGFQLYDQHHRIAASEEERLATQARVIRENLERNLESVNRVLVQLAARLPDSAVDAGLNRELALLTEAMPGVRTLQLLDRTGTIRASSRPETVGQNFGHRNYFARPQGRPSGGTLFVSEPYHTPNGIHVLAVSRAILDPGGNFAGVVSATIDPDYVRTLMQSVRYAPDMWTSIAHGDGAHFLMIPERPELTGKNLAQPGSFFSRHRESGRPASVMTGTVYATGEQRMVAVQSTDAARLGHDTPLVIAAARDLGTLFADWRRDAMAKLGLYALLVAASIGSLRVFQRRQREFARRDAEAAAALAASEHKLKTIIETEPECVALMAPDGTCLQMNAAGLAMFEAATEGQVLGRALADFVVPEQQAAFVALNERVMRGETGALEYELVGLEGGRRWLDSRAAPMREPGGAITGVLAVTRDVTARKTAALELERQAQIDSLTGLANRRHFFTLAERELARAERYGGPLSVLMLDIDHFKRINDTYGHQAGDQVLRRFAELCRAPLRSTDLVGRIGGEEFALVLPGTSAEGARDLAERLRERIAGAEFPLEHGRPLHATISVGVTTLASAGRNLDTLLAEADHALYECKTTGRNKVGLFRAFPPEAPPGAGEPPPPAG